MRVAVAGCRREYAGSAHDLYPDQDVTPVRSALAALGAEAVWVSWDDTSISWHDFNRVLISGTWDSVDRPVEYLEWARQVDGVSTLINSARLVEWNIDKHYLIELAAVGVATIPTDWVPPGQTWQPPQYNFVIKPSISAGGRSTACYAAGDSSADGHLSALHAAGHTAMVQPHLSSIATEGELDMVFMDGQLSHAFRRRLSLHVGDGIIPQPWERIAIEGLLAPSLEQIAIGRTVIEAVEGQVGLRPPYGRVDLVRGTDGSTMLVELELIDPYLALDLDPKAAYRLAPVVIDSP